MSGFDEYYTKWKKRNNIEEEKKVQNTSKTNTKQNNNTNLNLPSYRNTTTKLPTVKLATKEERKQAQEKGKETSVKKYATKQAIENAKDRIKFIAKNLDTGITQGTAGLIQGTLLDTANEMQKGKEKSLGTNAVNVFRSLTNPMAFDPKNIVENARENIGILTDKNKTGWQKATGMALNAVSQAKESIPAYKTISSLQQLAGKTIPQADQALLKANEKISAPVDKQRAKLEEESKNYGKATNLFARGANITGNMYPSILTSVATGNPDVALGVMGLSAKGQSTNEALNQGLDLDTANKIGDAKALVEVVTEKLSGGVGKVFGKGSLDDIAEEVIKKGAKSRFGKFLLKQGYNIAGETAEEWISNVADNFIDKGTVDPNRKIWDWREALRTLGETAVVTPFLGLTTGQMSQEYNEYKQDAIKEAQAQNQFREAEKLINQPVLPTQETTQQAKTQQALPTQETIQDNVEQKVFNYLKNNNINMPVDDFIKWASTKQLEKESNMTSQQQDLYNIISDIQNRSNKEYNQNNVDIAKNKYLDYNNKERNISDSMLAAYSADNRVEEYFKYNHTDKFYDLTYEEMQRASSAVSDRIAENNDGVAKDDKYIYDYYSENNDAKNYTITDVEKIDKDKENLINERIVNSDNRQTSSIREGQNGNTGNNQSVEDGATSSGTLSMDSEQPTINNNRNDKSGTQNSAIKDSGESSFNFHKQEQVDSSNNTEENEIQRKINRSMSMEQAKDMVQRAFVTGNIYDWFDGEYKNGDEWLAGEGADAVALIIDNDFNLQNKYVNSNDDILNDEYILDDVIEAYQNGTLTGSSEKQTQRLNTSKDTGYKDDRFYAPKDITGGKDLYDLASQRVTNKNRSEVYKARADFIINAHNEGYIESLGLTPKEVNEKLRSWTSYPQNALQTSMDINKGVAKENRWTGIENCSVVNELSVTQKQLKNMVKDIKGVSNDYQRRYISNTMLAIDTHMNYKNLTFDFAPDAQSMKESVLGDYQPDYDVIRVKRDGQNTVSHEIGHYIDHLIGRELANGYNLGLTRLCRSNLDGFSNGTIFTAEQKQFINNFSNFLEDIENSSDIGSSYKMSSDEVFARFVARFTEWTRNTATGNRYGYEAKWYDDHFNVSQYKEFARLLQEYSLLKTTGQADGRSVTLASQRTGKVQEQKIDDIYSELYDLQNKNILPTNKTMNPTEISQLTEADATTTPKLPTREYRKGNKQSNFAANILGDAQFIDKNIRQELAKDENVRYYQGITNEQTLEKAYKSLQEGGATETMKWYNKKDNITPEDVAKGWILLKQYQDAGDIQGMVEVAKKMRTMGTQAGQTVQAYNIMSRLTPEGMFYYAQSELSDAFDQFSKGKTQKWIDEHRSEFEITPEETQFIKDRMETVQNANDERTKKVALAEIQTMLQNKIPPTTGQGIKAWMRISMLFNPKTQVRNVMGNTVILPVNATSDVISGVIDKAIARKTGVRTTGVTKEGLKGYAQGFKRGLFESYDDFRKGINTRNVEGNRFEIGEGKSFKDKGVGKALNAIDSILSFSLDAGDRGFYEATFTNSINNQMVLNNTTEVTPEMIEIATNEALQRTWQDNNAYTKAVLGVRNILNNINVKGYGLGDVLIPFAKTPANLTKAIVDYSPAGLVRTLAVDARRFNNSLNNGQYSAQAQHDFVQNLGKGISGTFLYVLGSALAKAGIITGESDDDKDLKNFMKNTLGINSYSIKVGDKSFTYDWAQPVATPFAIMSNYEKYSKDNPDANALEKGIKALNIGSEQLLEQSFMESINTVLNGNGTTLENLSKAVLDLPARAIPTFSKQIADLVDSKQRTSFEYDKPIQSAVNSLKSKVPFVSRTLPVSKDTLGNTIEKYGGENNIFNVMLNPANVNKSTLNKAGKEIYDVYMATGDTTIFPRVAPYYINSKGEKTTLTSEQRSKFQETSGKYVENAMNGLLNNKDYNKMKNEDKAELINEIVTDSYAKAKYDVLGMDTDSYKKTRETLKDVSTTTYYDYKTKTSGLKKDKEKLEVLADANYKDKEKERIYREYFNKDDSLFDIAKKGKIDISQYLKYKANVENTRASAEDYLKKANISNEQKLLLLGTKYKLTTQEKATLAKYINNLNITKSDKLDIYKQLTGFKVNGDKVSW